MHDQNYNTFTFFLSLKPKSEVWERPRPEPKNISLRPENPS